MDRQSFKDTWSNIDDAANKAYFLSLLNTFTERNPDALQVYRPIFDLLHVQAGDHILEVGCGLGGAVRALAPFVGETGQVVGIDNSATFIAEAQKRSSEGTLPVAYHVADVHQLPFADESFASCFCRGVFEVLTDPAQALAEMIRVLRPGGRIVIPAPDTGTWVIDSSDKAFTRRIIDYVCDYETNGWIGRQLPRLYKELGLQQVRVSSETWMTDNLGLLSRLWLSDYLASAQAAGVVSELEVAHWLAELEQRDKDGCFFSALVTFTVSGQKPIRSRSLPLVQSEAPVARPARGVQHERKHSQNSPPPLACFQHLFEEQVACTPDAIALVCEHHHVSYAVLNRRSNQLARHLQRWGVGPEIPVGLYINRSPEMLIGLLGILKAGGAYVPFDPAYPAERLTYMLVDSRVSLVLTETPLLPALATSSAIAICLDTLLPTLTDAPSENLALQTVPANLAYIIYTSGSTGRPKGVPITHQGFVNLRQAQAHTFQIQPQSHVLQFSSLGFDASFFEIALALLAGATLYLIPQDTLLAGSSLAHLLHTQAIEVVTLTPTVLSSLPATDLPHLQTVIAAGEACSAELAARWLKGGRFFNAYGPTETTIWATVAAYTAASTTLSTGHPLPNVEIYLLDAQLKAVPYGEAGELCIGGITLGRGYLNRPDLTAERFVPHPYSQVPGTRLYRTGDRGRWLADGSIEYLGRIDTQVKWHGVRIELGEIEKVLQEHPAVQHALVQFQGKRQEEKTLVAYIVKDATYIKAREEELLAEAPSAQIATWQALTDAFYSQAHTAVVPAFNTVGWNSSYTGQPFAEEEMREWVDRTVERILSLRPQRVLEIGCGVGLLLLRIAPHCHWYQGTDFSAVALDYLQQQLSAQHLQHVSLSRRMADDFTSMTPGMCNGVILNSVVQHFPTIDYLLRVLEGAVDMVEPGGFVFVGDVQSLPLLDVFHTSVQLYLAPDSLPLSSLQQRMRDQRDSEPQLAIDPAFFLALKKRCPRISQVQVLLKRGHYSNELTQFRYDVILHIEQVASAVCEEPVRLDWQLQQLTLAMVHQYLTATAPKALVIKNVPNARVQAALDAAQWLTSRKDQASLTVGHLRQTLRETPSAPSIDPEEFWKLGQDLAYVVTVNWSGTGLDDGYTVIFARQALHIPTIAAEIYTSHEHTTTMPERWERYANNPLQGLLTRTLMDDVRSFLQRKLPPSMMPTTLMLLEAFPLTPAGKVDHQALPLPDPISKALLTGPRTAVEHELVMIWATVLQREHVGIHDHFFELGGHSLLATQVLSRVRDLFNVEVPLQRFFETPTIAQLSTLIEKLQVQNSRTKEPPLVPLTRARHKTTLSSLKRRGSTFDLTRNDP